MEITNVLLTPILVNSKENILLEMVSKDKDGSIDYWKTDDCINVSGHLLGTENECVC